MGEEEAEIKIKRFWCDEEKVDFERETEIGGILEKERLGGGMGGGKGNDRGKGKEDWEK